METWFLAVFDSTSDAVAVITGDDGRYAEVNGAFLSLCGLTRAEVIGRTVDEVGFLDRPWDEFIKRLGRRDRFDGIEVRFRRMPGQWREGVLSVRRVSGPNGDLVVTCLEDVSRARRVDGYLIALKRLAGAFADVRRFDARVLTAVEILGLASGAGRCYWALNARRDPAGMVMIRRAEWCAEGIEPSIDKPAAREVAYDPVFSQWWSTLSAGKPIIGRVSDFPAGEREALESRGVKTVLMIPLMVSGEFDGFIGFDNCRDHGQWDKTELGLLTIGANALAQAIESFRAIERRRELEEARDLFQAMFEGHPYPLLLVTRQRGTILAVNDAFEREWGYKLGDLRGKRALALYAQPGDRETMLSLLARENRLVEFETTGVKADGSLVPCVLSVEPVDLGGYPHLMVTAIDVTERKNLEAQLRQAQKMEAVGHLAGGIAHDFNNLLTGIMGNVNLALLDTHRDDIRFGRLEEALTVGERAAGLVSHLLAFARQAPGRVEAVSASKTIGEVLGIVKQTIDRRITTRNVVPPGEWWVMTNRAHLSQVLLNLCLNARDALVDRLGEDGQPFKEGMGPCLRVGVSRVKLTPADCLRSPTARPGRFVRITVADNGCGIEEAVLSRVFDPFFTTKDQGRGTGLGLATVFGLIKQHGGWIDVLSRVGRGTMFIFFLPVADQSGAAAVVETDLGQLPSGEETVLLVDDEEPIREVGRDFLDRLGYRVLLAEDGREAVNVFTDHRSEIDVVVMDLTMPLLSGYEALTAIRELSPQVRVIISSGHASQNESVEKLDATAYLSKPYRLDDLARMIRTVLDGPSVL